MKQLDVRHIISNSMAYNDFMRCFLSKPQRSLLSHQLSRIGLIDSDINSPTSSDKDPLGEFNSAQFGKDMESFEPRDIHDRNLVLGVLFQNGNIPEKNINESEDLSL